MKYFLFSFVLLFIACSDNPCDIDDLASKDNCDAPETTNGLNALELMDLYVFEEGLSVTKTNNNLYYQIINQGGGDKPNSSSDVTVDYVGYYRNGCSFDGASDITFNLQGLIQGWSQGIPLVGKCGTIKLIIPPSLAYGPSPTNGIKAGEPLIFDINLLDFE